MSVADHKLLIDIYRHSYLDTIPLPLQIEGRFWLFGKEDNRLMEVIQRKGSYDLVYEENAQSKIRLHLKSGNVYEVTCQGERILLMVRKYHKDDFTFLPYCCHGDITIGRAADNQIRYENPHVSKHHALLSVRENQWEISDCNSINGLYVNRKRIQNCKLKVGDHIDLLGLKLLISKDHIMINRTKDMQVHIALDSYQLELKKPLSITTQPYYHISPYTSPTQKEITLELESPLALPMKETMPLIYLLGPSITMGLSSISMAVFSLGNALINKQDMVQVIPTMLMAISMALGTILWPILGKRFEMKQRKKEKQKLTQQYNQYLQDIHKEIQELLHDEELMLRECYPDMRNLCENIRLRKNLWNHKKEDTTFLKLGIGSGSRKASFTLHYEKETLSLKENELYQKLKQTAQTRYILQHVPCVLDLQELMWLGFVGEAKDCHRLMQQLLLQLTAVHACTSVHIMLVVSKDDLLYGRYLPHIFNEDKTIRYLVHTAHDFKRIRQTMDAQDEDEEQIPMVIFHFDQTLHLSYPKEWMSKKSCILIQHASHVENLHQQCRKTIFVGKNSFTEEAITYSYPQLDDHQIHASFHQLSTLQILQEFHQARSEVSFLDLFQCSRIEDLKILDRWAKADCIHTLETPIGLLNDGELLYLDAHEQSHGPHGLMAGMTGSGKSETILTYILSLAVSYPPSDVAFLLIDYKGGAMAETFQKLPHVAGIITNLEQESVQRYIAAIESELKRRQELFRKTSLQYDRSSMDIAKYHELRLEHKEVAKLPHLFIIADEFAELKSLQPDFLDCLKQSARIGRSLGIHVILATQKPSGVVDDQIWSNSRFHICLKVQERGDSMEMLKCDDAAYLKRTGECYFQVGNNELFERALCAWSQAPYLPMDEYEAHQRKEVTLINATAQSIRTALFPLVRETMETQLEALLHYIQQLVKPKDGVTSLWMDALNGPIMMNDIRNTYGYREGIYALGDDIHHQKQYPLAYPFHELKHTALYGMANSGKSELLTTLIYSWIQDSSDKISIVLLDFDKFGFDELRPASCICDVLTNEDTEAIHSLFYQLKTQVDLRKGGANSWPFLIIIHNYEIFNEEYADELDCLQYLMREGEKVNIYILITLTGPGNLSYRIAQYLHKTITLRLKDPSDYRQLYPDRDSLSPAQGKGSGMVIDEKLLLFQTITYEKQEQQQIIEAHQGENCFHIPLLPNRINQEPQHALSSLFLGYEILSKEPVYLPLLKKRWTYITGSYTIYPPFMNAIITSMKNSELPIYLCCASSLDQTSIKEIEGEYRTYLKDAEGIVVWQGFYRIQSMLDTALIQQLLKEIPHHIIIEEIQQLQLYTGSDWFSYSLQEANVIWIGKGFQDNQYTLKRATKDHEDIKDRNHAFVWKENQCIEIQVWENDENG